MNAKIEAPAGYEWKRLGVCGVDSGTLMVCDPCYFVGPDADAAKAFPGGWGGFCSKILDEHATQLDYARGHAGLGVVNGTAYGDGEYAVYGLFPSNGDRRCMGMMVMTGDVGVAGFESEEDGDE